MSSKSRLSSSSSTAGISPDIETTLQATGQSLAATLEELLRPLGLAFQIVDGRTIQVTTVQAASARQDLEFYPLTDLVHDDATAAELVQQVQAVPARHGRVVLRGDALHLGPVRGLPVAGVTEHHALPGQGMKVPLLSRVA